MDAEVQIGDQTMSCHAAGLGGWIEQQIRRRRAGGDPVCIIVRIPAYGLSLGVGQCSYGAGPPVQQSAERDRLIELWEQRVKKHPPAPGPIVAFLREIGCRVAA